MCWYRYLLAAGLAALLILSGAALRAAVIEEFGTDPVAGGRATVVGSNQSTDTSGNPAAPFVVSTPGVLTHNLNSNWRTGGGGIPDTSQYIADASRLHIPLGGTYTEADRFAFGATLRIRRPGLFWSGSFMQMSFGLVHSATTGMDRTSSLSSLGDTYDGIEWDFFPNTGSATVQPVLFGSQQGTTSAFNRIAAEFGYFLPAGPPPFDYGLPLDTWMDVQVTYDGPTRTAGVSVVDSVTGAPYVDQTSVPDVVLPATWLTDGAPAHFAVDTLAVLNYQDAWAVTAPSLVAEVEYDRVWFGEAGPIPEPASCGAVGLGLLALARRRMRRS